MSEETEVQKVERKAARKVQLKKIDVETSKLLAQIKEKANRKSFGRKVRDGEIIRAAIRLIGPQEIQQLQELTYSERDRLQMVHEAYQREHGKISLDQFIGKLMRGEVKNQN